MEHLIGFIILGLSIICLVGGLIFRNYIWNKNRPKNVYRGVRYEFLSGCVEWKDFHATIDLLFNELDNAKDVLSDLHIWITPYEKPINSLDFPTGFVSKNGKSVPPPRTELQAKEVGILNGLTELEKKWPLSRSTVRVYVRQHRPTDKPIDARLLRGIGAVVNKASKSALLHEIIEHVYPYRKGENINASHSRKDLTELSRELTKKINDSSN